MRRALFLILTAFLLASPAQAQNYPTRLIRMIVPFPPGGVADVVARVIGQRLSEALGQQVIIENKAGASGIIGVDTAVKSAPDGYTVLMTTGDFLTVSSLMPPMSFDRNRDLIPITMVASAPLLMGATVGGPINSVKELIAAAKAKPGAIAFSSPGNGTINHIAGEWVAIAGGVKLLHVPYRGGVPAAIAIGTGEVPVGMVTPSSVAALVQANKVRIIALMSKDRPSFGPGWPTAVEEGLPELEASLWVGLFAPANTPPAIVKRLNDEVARILQDDGVRRRLNDVGTDAMPISAEAFRERIRADAERYERIVRQAGIRVEH